MFLLIKGNNPVAVYEKLPDLIHDIERRIKIDYLAFERSNRFNIEPFELDPYLDLKIFICKKNEINWVDIDFKLDEIELYDLMNEESSGVLAEIDKYNTNFLTSVLQE